MRLKIPLRDAQGAEKQKILEIKLEDLEKGIKEMPAILVKAEDIKELCDYDWPGNVRELENAIYRCLEFTRVEYMKVWNSDLEKKKRIDEIGMVMQIKPFKDHVEFINEESSEENSDQKEKSKTKKKTKKKSE